MTKASDNLFPKILLDMQTSDPAAPSDEDWKMYAKPDGVYARSSNAIVGPFGSGGAGAVATDAIWDAKGDLAVGTGANTASKLTVGTNGYLVEAQSGEATGLLWRGFVGAKAYHNTTQSVNGTAALNLNTELFDTDAFHDTVTNNTRMTIPAGLGGYYDIRGATFVAALTDWFAIRIDGTTYIEGSSQNLHAAGRWNCQAVVNLTAGQYVELVGNTSGAVNFGHASAADARTTLTIVRLR